MKLSIWKEKTYKMEAIKEVTNDLKKKKEEIKRN